MESTNKNLNKHRALNAGIILTLLPHLFCCVLPIVLAIAGIVAPGAAHWHIIPHYLEPWLFVFSGLMLALSWAMVMDHGHSHCDNCDAPRGHKTQKIILCVVTALFVISLILFFVGHHH